VGGHHVGQVGAAVQQLVDLEVEVLVGAAALGDVVGLGEEARRAQDQHGQPVVAVDELAEVLGGDLRRAVDVLGDGADVLVDPRGGRARRRRQRAAERARRRREHERADAGGDRLLEQVQRPGHVDVDEVPARVGSDMRLVQRRRVHDGVDARHRRAHHRPVRDRAHDLGGRGGQDVDPAHVVAALAQHAHEALTEVSRAARDEDPHACKA
jgi:hypothetical protein